jgi:glycerophosphoryl diester phosphodiesterase
MSPAPIIVAHRGLHDEHPENSLAAFRAAWEARIEWCECDVHLSWDCDAIVIHDDTLDRTTDGTGPVAQATTASLRPRRLRRADGSLSEERLPTLAEVLRIMPAGCGLLLEIKPALAKELLATMQRVVGNHRVTVQSFHRAVAEDARSIATRTEWLTEEPLSAGDLPKCGGINIRHDLLDSAALRRVREAGMSIGVWTPNSEPDLRRAIELGVDSIISDEPLLARQLIAKGQ